MKRKLDAVAIEAAATPSLDVGGSFVWQGSGFHRVARREWLTEPMENENIVYI
jgi:hypothetical protein